ncbi:cytochrome bc1 complex Rieske iron-sulfur subunit [Kineosporia succinea]|uniref:Cytochrome bc1 complex Rieske iron-sulfur subunit n=1 Tax=Kineosporia succinea TaxID=84632 RepID=A0ABT9P6C3_9ACTN|nr:Rieske 2Fe-2S domain-containing protein [Kineosporia succinea]MDP9828232.1 ubiquinol-cytochrome c reductase iron-sulfur subunit [Kineosporia succinea]
MSTNDPDDEGKEVARHEGDLPSKFENPGLPAHPHRLTDVDPKTARRAERQVAFLFLLSMVGTLVMIVGYFVVKMDHDLGFVAYLERLELSNKVLGIGMAISLLGIGVGAVHWAKTLMPDEEKIDYRHLQRGSDEERTEAVEKLATGVEESGFARRPLIRNTLLGAMALFPLPGVLLFRDTGPLPGRDLAETFWKAGDRLMLDPEGGPIKASDMVLGAVAHILPEGIEESEHPLNEKAKAAVLLIRLEEDLLAPESIPGSYAGIVAYSKICTHMGCPVALYEQRTHHLLCPCHQSTFDLTQNCKVIFGPAKRALPQLAITVDDEGYLVAKAPFSEPTGPSYWERSS